MNNHAIKLEHMYFLWDSVRLSCRIERDGLVLFVKLNFTGGSFFIYLSELPFIQIDIILINKMDPNLPENSNLNLNSIGKVSLILPRAE